MTVHQSPTVLRAATRDDVEDIATIWHHAWIDGHRGHVPPGLEAHRQLDHFLARVPPRIEVTTVAVAGGAVVGFVSVHEDELEELFVAAAARGTGVAAALLAHGEARIAARFDRAWLAVVAGNVRARRFYERCGWSDAGALDYPAETLSGSFIVPSRRYEKELGHVG